MHLTLTASVLLCLGTVGCSEAVGNWSGETRAAVTIRVVGEKDGAPIVSARVWLLTGADRYAYLLAAKDRDGFTKINGPIEGFGSRVFTDPAGRAKIWTPFSSGGALLADGSRTTHVFVSGIIVVEGWKMERFESELEPLLPPGRKSDSSAPISITVRLKEEANQPPQPMPLTRHG